MKKCGYCKTSCGLPRILPDGRTVKLATCWPGVLHDRGEYGTDYLTAVIPGTGRPYPPAALAALTAYHALSTSGGNTTLAPPHDDAAGRVNTTVAA